MKITKDNHGIKIDFEGEDTFEVKQMMQAHIESMFNLIRILGSKI